jgi:hypothetical protein
MFQVQVCFVYLLCNVQRYDSSAWWRGEALHMAMAHTVFGRLTFVDWYRYYPFTAPLSYAAWAVELMASGFLLFHKRIGPWLVLALTALHVLLQLTAMVQYWQVLMMAALVAFWPETWLTRGGARLRSRASVASGGGESAPRQIRKKALALGFIALWVSVLVANVPVEWGEGVVTSARALLFPVHVLLGLGGNYGMRMFDKPPRRGSVCMIALGFGGAGAPSELLFAPPVRDCVDRRFRWRQDNVHHAFYKYFGMLVLPGTIYRGGARWSKTPEAFQADLGEMFCRQSRSEGRAVSRVFVGQFRETFDPRYSQRLRRGEPVHHHRELRRGFGYQCDRHALTPIALPEVFAALARDHPALSEVFAGYQPAPGIANDF